MVASEDQKFRQETKLKLLPVQKTSWCENTIGSREIRITRAMLKRQFEVFSHGGGKRCEEPGCGKGAIGSTSRCIAHGGGKRCEELGCDKSAQGLMSRCIRHGGGKRCEKPGCGKSALGSTSKCVTHGGGKRCEKPGCGKSAQGSTGRCHKHRRGNDREEPRCEITAKGPTDGRGGGVDGGGDNSGKGKAGAALKHSETRMATFERQTGQVFKEVKEEGGGVGGSDAEAAATCAAQQQTGKWTPTTADNILIMASKHADQVDGSTW